MNKLSTIIQREYWTRVKSKGFLLGTIITPLLMVSLLLLPAMLTSLTGTGWRTSYRIVILDRFPTPVLSERVCALLVAENQKLDRFEVRHEAIAEIQFDARSRELNEELGKGTLSAYVVIPASVLDEGKIAYHARGSGDFISEMRIENAFNTAVVERRMMQAGLDFGQISALSKRIEMERFDEHGASADRGKTFVALALMGILCLTVFAYGAHVLSAVIEEKQSRVLEVLLSSVRPFQLMLGKLIGVGLVGLTQCTIWAICALLLGGHAAAPLSVLGAFRLPDISVSLMVFFIVYFLLGYFLYATLYALVGGIVSNEEDGQQAQFPLMIIILLAPVASTFVWRHPDSAVGTAISLFPFFTPFAMFLRIATQPPPGWQIAFSILSMIFAILAAVWLAAKFYRVSVLMYGKRPTLPEMGKWLMYSMAEGKRMGK
jgi:ABC-2 type transport system permease protein